MEAGQKIEAFMTLTQPTKITVFEPHMHAAARAHVPRRDLRLAHAKP